MNETLFKSDDFHKICDNKGPTLILAETIDNKKIGGFTPLSWNMTDKFICDESNQTFVFSLNLKKKI